MINRIYSTVKFISNNQVQGNVTPTEFNIALYNAILEKFEGYFTELNYYINRENRGLITESFGDIPEKIKEKIAHFLKTETIAVDLDEEDEDFPIATFTLPEDHRYTDYLVNKSNRKPFELSASLAQFDTVNRLKHTRPNINNPIAIKEGNTYRVLPNELENIILYYLRNPLKPNWTYVVVNNKELFNPADPAFQDADMHISEETDLTLMVLKSFGINLKDAELTNIANSEEAQEFQKQHSL